MREIWGLLPATGKATRIGRRKGPSREVVPLPPATGASAGTPPRIACQDLLDNFRLAGVTRTLVLLRQGKWDVPKRLGDGAEFGVDLAFRVLTESRGVPFAVAAAAPFLGDRMAAVGFPDLLLQPRDLLARLVRHREQTQGDLALALVPLAPGDRLQNSDRVDLSARGKVRRFEILPEASALKWTWALALWTPRFTKYLMRWTETWNPRSARLGREVRLTDVFAAALAEGFEIDGLPEAAGKLLEIPPPEAPL